MPDTPLELKPYQERVPFTEIEAGDFVDCVEPLRVQGPRGGRYRYYGVDVLSRVKDVHIDYPGNRVAVQTVSHGQLYFKLAILDTTVIRRVRKAA